MTRANAETVVRLMGKIEDVELAMDEVQCNDVLVETGYEQTLFNILSDKRKELLQQLEELKFEEET